MTQALLLREQYVKPTARSMAAMVDQRCRKAEFTRADIDDAIGGPLTGSREIGLKGLGKERKAPGNVKGPVPTLFIGNVSLCRMHIVFFCLLMKIYHFEHC